MEGRTDASFEALIAAADAAMDASDWNRARDIAAQAVGLFPASAVAHYKLAVANQALLRLAEAERGYRDALALDPMYGRALNNLGCLYLQREDRAAAAEAFQRAIAADPTIAEPHSNLGIALLATSRAALALDCFRRAIALDPKLVDARLLLTQCMRDLGEDAEAERCAGEALAAGGDDRLELRLALMLPAIMHSREAIVRSRRRLESGLAALASRIPAIEDPVAAVPNCDWFFLAYHGLNDRQLMSELAEFFQIACPSLGFQAPHCAVRGGARRGSRIRLGFVSSHLAEHTIGRLTMGVIANLPREVFEVDVFMTAREPDRVSRFIEAHADRVVTLAPSLADARMQIADAALDILFYPDIGMDPLTYFLAYSRLAPLQCVTWGHPMTTGIPAIDCFVSHAACELPGAQQFYSERLLMLPEGDALTYYYRPDAGPLSKTRADFGLAPSSNVYLCPQTLFKLHPDQDAVFQQILASDPDGVLVLLEGPRPLWKEAILSRLRKCMPGEVSRVRFLPGMQLQDFLNLVKVSDVVLDTFPFGGGNTSIEAFALGRPVVTLPSDQLRGRLTYACCRRMGMDELIADSPQDFVAKALRLGMDRVHRDAVTRKITACADSLFEDRGMVRHLSSLLVEAFERATAA